MTDPREAVRAVFWLAVLGALVLFGGVVLDRVRAAARAAL